MGYGATLVLVALGMGALADRWGSNSWAYFSVMVLFTLGFVSLALMQLIEHDDS